MFGFLKFFFKLGKTYNKLVKFFYILLMNHSVRLNNFWMSGKKFVNKEDKIFGCVSSLENKILLDADNNART